MFTYSILSGTPPISTNYESYQSQPGPRVTLPGNVPPRLRGLTPLGPVDPALPMARMILALRMSPEARQRLDQLREAQHDPGSPRFHAWLQPEEFAAAFGPGPAELARVTGWLKGQGFTVEGVARGGLSVVFSGTAETVQRAFQVPLRRFSVDGREHLGNAADPSIPAELAGVVQGVVSLHDLPRRAAHRQPQAPAPQFTVGGAHYLAPADLATIYDLVPLHAAGTDGTGVAIAIIGRTDPGLDDVYAFRTQFAVGTGTTAIILNGPDPGSVSPDEDVEANLDMQWSGAAAPGAAIQFVCSASTSASDGVDLSAQYAVNQNLAPVMSLSFGECEAALGQTELDFYASLWAQADAQGITVCVASGDSGAAGCDGGGAGLGTGPAVSGLASTPSNVCVGGTMFEDAGGGWWAASNGMTGGSALGYIPEAAWNESGSVPGGTGLWAGGGGPSMIYAKPSWQAGPGVPADGHRDTPDVALSASGHDGYLIRTGGTLMAVGGTSAAAPSFAGMVALLVQASRNRQGNPGSLLYPLAAAQAAGSGPAVFHDITAGDNTVPGTSGYQAAAGYDLATGLGSLDGYALVGARTGLAMSPAQVDLTVPVGAAFSQAFAASGGNGPYSYASLLNPLPPGLSLSAAGVLAGTLATEGTFDFAIQAVDAQGKIGLARGSLQVGPVAVSASLTEAGQLSGTPADYSATVTGALDTSVQWSASGGTLTTGAAGGATFQAAAPGVYTLTAAATASPKRTATLTVTVHDADFENGHAGKPVTGLDALALAGAFGAHTPDEDCNGDGVVDELDLDMIFKQLGW